MPVPSLDALPVLDLPRIRPVDPDRAWRPRRAAYGRRCVRCGVEVNRHPKCEACGILVGPHHTLGLGTLVGGQCLGCRT